MIMILNFLKIKQDGQDLNLQPAVLETAALPFELPTYKRMRLARNRPLSRTALYRLPSLWTHLDWLLPSSIHRVPAPPL